MGKGGAAPRLAWPPLLGRGRWGARTPRGRRCRFFPRAIFLKGAGCERLLRSTTRWHDPAGLLLAAAPPPRGHGEDAAPVTAAADPSAEIAPGGRVAG